MKASETQLNCARQNLERIELELKDCKVKAQQASQNKGKCFKDSLDRGLAWCYRYGAAGPRFDSWAGQIKRRVADDSPPVRSLEVFCGARSRHS